MQNTSQPQFKKIKLELIIGLAICLSIILFMPALQRQSMKEQAAYEKMTPEQKAQKDQEKLSAAITLMAG